MRVPVERSPTKSVTERRELGGTVSESRTYDMSPDETDPTDGSNSDSKTRLIRIDRDQFDRPTTGIVEAVSAVTDRNPSELPALYDVVDPDALETLYDSERVSHGDGVSVSFEYAGVVVVVRSGGGIEIRPISADDTFSE